MEFDLLEFQKSIIAQGRDLFAPNQQDLNDVKKQAERIKQMYRQARTDQKLRKNIYDNLFGDDTILKLATIDLIYNFPDEHSAEILFKALEDEPSIHIRQNIVRTLDALEAKNNHYPQNHDISIVKALNYAKVI